MNQIVSQYCQASAINLGAIFNFFLGTFVYVLYKITKDASWIDRIWSILPIFYSLHILFYQIHCQQLALSIRQIIMFIFITLWGIRLTYNFCRKGFGEDYRWNYIRTQYHWILVELLMLIFVPYLQVYLIYAFSIPIAFSRKTPFNILDIILAIIWILLFLVQVIADQQQWNYQTSKYKLLNSGHKLENLPDEYRKGFINDGFFKYSRHPNFFCEIMMWWILYGFSVVSIGVNWTGIGALGLNLLFLGSTKLTQKITSEKYPLYKQYQANTSMLIPMPLKKSKQHLG